MWSNMFLMQTVHVETLISPTAITIKQVLLHRQVFRLINRERGEYDKEINVGFTNYHVPSEG